MPINGYKNTMRIRNSVIALSHFTTGNLNSVFLLKISRANNMATMMNRALATADMILQAKIRKNTIPFQAKAKQRNNFKRIFTLGLALTNVKYVSTTAIIIIIICTGRVVSLYAPI